MNTLLGCLWGFLPVWAVAGENVVKPVYEVLHLKDLSFAQVDGQELLLDLYLPNGVESPPLVVFVHGGGWRSGSHRNCRIDWAAEHGFAVASISYRLTDVAIFPAQIHDCKAAIRWLRTHADKYGYDATKIAVAGSSAGGHLAVLLGTSGGDPELEGTVGGNIDQSSRLQAVVNYFGPTDFILRAESQPELANSTEAGSFALLGGLRTGKVDADLARQASGAMYVGEGDPPLLTIHGADDRRVLPDQAHRITDVYATHGLPATLRLVPGAGHGAKSLFEGEHRTAVVEFLKRHLVDQD